MTIWKGSSGAKMFRECKDKGYHMEIIAIGFNEIKILCRETQTVWRIVGSFSKTSMEEYKAYSRGGKQDK